jgi:hypothetical protein
MISDLLVLSLTWFHYFGICHRDPPKKSGDPPTLSPTIAFRASLIAEPSSALLSAPGADRRHLLEKKQLSMFLQMFNILRKKGEIDFQKRWNQISIHFYFK